MTRLILLLVLCGIADYARHGRDRGMVAGFAVGVVLVLWG
jgi:hypothetical protein